MQGSQARKLAASPLACLMAAIGVGCGPAVEAPQPGERDCTAANHCRLVDGAAECEPGYDWVDPDPSHGDYRCAALADAAVAYDAAAGQDAGPGVDAARPDSAGTDSTMPDSAMADAATADSAMADTAMADTAMADSARPDSAMADSAMADGAMADGAMADSAAPDTAAADTAMPDTAVPDAAIPDAAAPDTSLCEHECPAFGASCSGSVLNTCVYDAYGCRVLLQQTCRLGCQNGACNTCSSIPDPMLDAVSTGQTGWYKDLVLHGDAAISNWQERDGIYTQQGTGLTVVNVANPSAMTLLHDATYDPVNYITDLELVGDKLYFLMRQGMEIYDVSDPNSPSRLGGFALHNDAAIKRDLSVDGDLACIAADDGLHLVDVSQAGAPVELGLYEPPQWTNQVRCRGRWAAITPCYKLQIVDLIDPNEPVLAAEIATSNQSNYNDNITFDGSRAFLWTYSPYGGSTVSQLDAYQFTAPDQLVKVGSMQTGMSAAYAALSGDQLFFSAGSTAGSIDVGSPSAMRWAERFWVPDDDPKGLVFDGDTLFVASDGVKAFDLDLAPDIVLLDTAGTDFLSASAQLGSIVLQARSNSGLSILDLRLPTQPVVMANVDLPSTGVQIKGHYAYAVGYDGSGVALKVYDISSPWEPLEVGSVATPDAIGQLTVSGNRAYAICAIGRICVFDIGNPYDPQLLVQSDAILQTLGTASISSAFVMDGDTLYLPEPDMLTVVDMGDHNNPVTVGSLELPGYIGPVRSAVAGDVLTLVMPCFYISGDNCYYTVDISNPSDPSMLGSLVQFQNFGRGSCDTLNSHPCISSLYLHGARAYLSHMWGGISVVDLADPSDPQLITELWTTRAARRMFVSERYLTTYTETGFPQGGPYGQADQVIEMCR